MGVDWPLRWAIQTSHGATNIISPSR